MEAKIEDLAKAEELYMQRIEQLHLKLAEAELQRAKDKEYILDIQNAFEESDRKQAILLEGYETKINEQENIILKLNRSLSMNQGSSIGETASKNIEVQTEPYSISHANNTPLVIEIGFLKKNYTILEQKILTLEAEVHTLNTAKSKITNSNQGKESKSCNLIKTPRGKPNVGQTKNVFSVSLQVKKMKEKNFHPAKSTEFCPKQQEEVLNTGKADLYVLNELDHKRGKKTQTVYPSQKTFYNLTHPLKEKENTYQAAAQVHKPAEEKARATNHCKTNSIPTTITVTKKKPPCSAKLLQEGETYEEFFVRNIAECETQTASGLSFNSHPTKTLTFINVEENSKSEQMDNFLVLRLRKESKQKIHMPKTFINSKLKKH